MTIARDLILLFAYATVAGVAMGLLVGAALRLTMGSLPSSLPMPITAIVILALLMAWLLVVGVTLAPHGMAIAEALIQWWRS